MYGFGEGLEGGNSGVDGSSRRIIVVGDAVAFSNALEAVRQALEGAEGFGEQGMGYPAGDGGRKPAKACCSSSLIALSFSGSSCGVAMPPPALNMSSLRCLKSARTLANCSA